MSISRLASSVLHKLLPVALLFGLLVPAHAASQPDPCNSLSFKQSVVINVTTATTTQLVAVNANHGIFVCGFTMTIAGTATTASTASFEYGTSTNCTGTNALTGTFGSNDAAVSTTPTQVTYGDGNSTILTPIPPNNGLCLVSGGTSSNLIEGVVTYVQGSGSSYP